MQEAYQGDENIRSYPSATAAADASPIYTSDVNDPNAAPGDLWYFWWNPDGHVGTVLGHDLDGRVLITHTSSSGDLVEQWTNNVRISHADTIPHKFRGGSHHYGVNRRREGLTPWPVKKTRRSSRMHAVRQIGLPDSGVIIGGGQPPRARVNSVFVAECAGLGITPIDCPDWQYGTIIREAWADFNTTAEYLAKAVAGKMPSGGTSPIGLSDEDAKRIAKAVADEHATRMKS